MREGCEGCQHLRCSVGHHHAGIQLQAAQPGEASNGLRGCQGHMVALLQAQAGQP